MKRIWTITLSIACTFVVGCTIAPLPERVDGTDTGPATDAVVDTQTVADTSADTAPEDVQISDTTAQDSTAEDTGSATDIAASDVPADTSPEDVTVADDADIAPLLMAAKAKGRAA